MGPRRHVPEASIRRYWTRERMLAATPRNITRPGTTSLDLSRALAVSGTPLRTSSGRPSFMARTAVRRPRSIEVLDPTVFPFATQGKLFSTDETGDYVCSATVVTAQGRNMIWTAGHCVTSDGVWAENIEFVPGYDNGSAPFGEWVAESWGTSQQWANNNNFSYDYAVVFFPPNSLGVELGDVVGWRGMAFNESRDQDFTSFGYPAASPFDGQTLRRCDSRWLGDDDYEYSALPSMSIDCDMTGGSSGGGWIIDGDDGDGFLNSLNSYGYDDLPDVMFGPYFGDVAADLWAAADEASTEESPDPDPSPTPPDVDVEIHEMILTLNLKYHLTALGRMYAPDGFKACTRGAPIDLYRGYRGEWLFVKSTTTNNRGRYRFSLRDKPGTYLAYSIDGVVDDLNSCTESESGVRRHRH
jgi:V8-like Glu-specific endopeptidase